MALRKTYISATTGKPFHVTDLTPTSLLAYSQLMGRIQVAAREYDGSDYRRIKFMTLARDIAEMAGGSADMVDAYARQANPGNNAVFSLDDLFLNARARLRGPKDMESPFGLIFKRLKDYDSKVVKQTKPLEIEKQPEGKASYQPRLAAIIDVLCEQYRGIENLKITTGPYTLPKDLRDSYVVLSFKKSPLKIAVCDDESMPTYISSSDSAEFWKEPGVKSIRSYDFDFYMEQVHKALGYTPVTQPNLHMLTGSVIALPVNDEPEEDKPFKAKPTKAAVPEAAQTAAAPRVETDSLTQAAFVWAAMPRAEAEPLEEEPEVAPIAAATTPDVVAVAENGHRTSRGPRNDPEARYNKIAADIVSYAAATRKWPSTENSPLATMPCQLWQAHEQWLCGRGQSLAKVVNNLVYNLALLHEQHTGEKPTRHSGDIAAAPGLNWAIIDDCYISKQRRTENLDIVLRREEPGHEERVAAEKQRRINARSSKGALQLAI